jgi:hypothetical protein
MEIKRSGSQPSGKGPADYFTGAVRVDPLFQGPDPACVRGASVTFEPGARTAWHTHPLGQTLIVTSGCGRVQAWGGPVDEIRPGGCVVQVERLREPLQGADRSRRDEIFREPQNQCHYDRQNQESNVRLQPQVAVIDEAEDGGNTQQAGDRREGLHLCPFLVQPGTEPCPRTLPRIGRSR